MSKSASTPRAGAFFSNLLTRPWLAICVGVALILIAGGGLTKLVKDPSTDSLIPPSHDSIAASDRAKEIFGLADPIVVSVSARDAKGIFTPKGLDAVKQVHDYLSDLDNIRSDRVVSIASESRIHGTETALNVDRFFDAPPDDQVEADRIREAVFSSAPHIGSIVAEDGSGALVVAEFYDESRAGETYEEVLTHISGLGIAGIEVGVAGQGAVTGYLSKSIDNDSKRLPPVAALVIFALIWLAFGRAKALVAPLFVTLATVVGAVGIMAWVKVPYYVITGALPVILIAIAVADSIHILTGYYERRAAKPDATVVDIVVSTMADLWRPLTLTTFTTIAGFIGIGIASVMPPMAWFGWFAALGVLIAWLASMLVLPAILVKLDLVASPRIRAGRYGAISDQLTAFSQLIAARPIQSLAVVGAASLAGAFFATTVVADNSRISNFRENQPIRAADDTLNTHFAGTAYLDVIVESSTADGLLSAAAMERIDALQEFLEAQPHVQETTSIADYVSELHAALSGEASGTLPENDSAVAQYLLLYEMSGDPTDLEDEIDMDYQHAFVRAYLNADRTSEQTPALKALDTYLKTTFNTDDLTGTISGRVNIDYHWMQELVTSHARSVLLSLLFVFLIAAALFRSVVFGLIALAPVGVALISVYGVMGAFGIFIEPGTSMFAAIAIGVGVDFSIHFIDRLQKGVREDGLDVRGAIAKRYPASARACFLNGATLAVGFSVLLVSELPPVFKLGLLIAIAATASFAGGLVLSTAATALVARPRKHTELKTRIASGVIIVLVGSAFPGSWAIAKAQDMDGPAIAEQIAARHDGDHMSRMITMEIIDRRGRNRVREAVIFLVLPP